MGALYRFIQCLVIATVLVGCGGGGGSGGDANAGNTAPVANAGPAQKVVTGMLVTLTGNGSSDANGDPLTYAWTLTSKPAGSNAALAGATLATPSFTADAVGTYIASLIVNDGKVNSAESTVMVTATAANAVPVANAGANQTVVAAAVVTLNGSASWDANGDPLTYVWTLTSKPAGSSAALIGGNSIMPSFTADAVGTYVASLLVNDGKVNSAASTVTVIATVANGAPVADAGVSQSVTTITLITLDGTASSDPDGDPLTYAWTLISKPVGSTPLFYAQNTPKPQFQANSSGTYVFSLVVSDGNFSSAPSTVTVIASVPNAAPVANAGPNQAVVAAAVVTLNGSASWDANGDPLTYVWTLTSMPAGSKTALVGGTLATPSFTADAVGTYVASLVVSDGKLSSAASTVTVTVSGVNEFANIAGGSYYSTALKSDGTVWTWGHNLNGELGDASRGYQTNNPNPLPLAVVGLTGVVAIAVGDRHTVALKSDGTVVGWGYSSYGELGTGAIGSQASPVQVSGLTGIRQVSTGCNDTVALKSDGTVVAQGSNFKGQLGDGTTTDRLSPVAVPGLTGVVEVSAGCFFTLALKSDGTVWAWGSYAGGVLADGTVIDSPSPIPVAALSGVARVVAATSGGHALALRSDGTVWAWGSNLFGQLGDGTLRNRWTWQAVQGLTGIVAVAAGNDHSVAVKSDGTVWAWGYNGLGQLGDGTQTLRTGPVMVPGLTGVVAVAGGNAHTLAVKSDGTVWGWGYNAEGQLGIGTINPEILLIPRAVAGGFALQN